MAGKTNYWRHVVCDDCYRRCRYKDFRVFDKYGFAETVYEMYVKSDDSTDWQYKRRGTVLGRMHAHKRELWEEMLRTCPHVGEEDK